ncbi:MAG: hypothetical protein C0618_06810 [Desulfuromonas sp.]|nr:MAG: hypothetical protein C0618_06810 [Desulfuromonas sp.]
MRRSFLLILSFVLLCGSYVDAAVELAARGENPVLLQDVYIFNGVPYVAVDDALDAVSLRGHWNSITHVYRIKTARGWAEITPGSAYLKFGERHYPLGTKPRFIDGRLRVAEDFLVDQLPRLIDRSVYYRNLDPLPTRKVEGEGALDRLFAFLLRKKKTVAGPDLTGVAIDPGHGGLDNGVIAATGLREKDVNLQLARRLQKLFKMRLGVPVYLSRDDDYELTAEQRVAPAARDNVDVWLLLHAQASYGPTPQGVVLLIRRDQPVSASPSVEKSPSLQLAEQMSQALREAGFDVAGIQPTDRLPLGDGDLPTVQIESGYFSNPQDLARLENPDDQELFVQALFQGVLNFVRLEEENR